MSDLIQQGLKSNLFEFNDDTTYITYNTNQSLAQMQEKSKKLNCLATKVLKKAKKEVENIILEKQGA
ncbi:MAG: hypothetical protein JJV95_07585 [Sulfurospirillum sp.]|nr:hypothetical protein [Sulfurospirillum sp.]MBL0703822.1 hypothetical protein [Sulfurospirillum sp.]